MNRKKRSVYGIKSDIFNGLNGFVEWSKFRKKKKLLNIWKFLAICSNLCTLSKLQLKIIILIRNIKPNIKYCFWIIEPSSTGVKKTQNRQNEMSKRRNYKDRLSYSLLSSQKLENSSRKEHIQVGVDFSAWALGNILETHQIQRYTTASKSSTKL